MSIKIIAFLICIFMILNFSLATTAHPLVLDVSYDDCSREALVDGTNEMWYKIDEISSEFPNTSFHLSDEMHEIRYYFSSTSENSQDDWITCVKLAASGEPWYITLSDDEASDIVERIQKVYVDSMKKWNDVYYFSYDSNGNRVANKVITVREGTTTNHNLTIYPTAVQGASISSTAFDCKVADWDVLEYNHAHIPEYKMTVNVRDFYQALEAVTPDTEAEENAVRENTGAHEIGHVLGLADLDVWCDINCTCDVCKDGNPDNDSTCVQEHHHEETLMGYGELSSRVTHITYKDIAGVSITRGFHTDSDHLWMVREIRNESTNEIEQIDVVCALCNGVRTNLQAHGVVPSKIDYINGEYVYQNQEVPLMGSCNGAHSPASNNMILVATDGERVFFKCRCCRYIGEAEIVNLPAVPVHDTLDYCENMGGFGYKYYNIDIPYDEIFNFKFNADGDFNIVLCDSDFNETDLLDISMYSTNGCDVDLQQGRYYLCVKNTVNTNNEFNMTVTPPCLSHSFTEWTQHTPARHIECCEYCGEKGTITSPHAIRKEDISKLFANCMVCGQLVNLKNTIVNVPEMNKITQVTLNGSYILPNGIIVLVDEDIEAYENGTLVWYDKDDLPQAQ